MCTKTATERQQPPRHPERRLSLRSRRQRNASVVLDAATTAYVLHYLHGDPSYLNPWNLPSARLWLLGFLAIRLGIVFYDHLVVLVIENCLGGKVLPTREPGAPPVRYVSLDVRSVVYLTLNSFNEYAFVMRLTHYLWHGGGWANHRGHEQSPPLPWKLSELTVGNTILALGVMFVSMDALYAPLHHALHLPALYPLVHKHHHRQHFPRRGYLDAGNEHPIEHMIGVLCTWFAVCAAEAMLPTLGMWMELSRERGMSSSLSDDTGGGVDSVAPWTRGGGVHALTVLIFFQFHAALAMLNHSPYDVRFSLPFAGSGALFGCGANDEGGGLLLRLATGRWFRYSVGHHEMHHRKFNYNYGQYCMLYDKLMGTFIEYEGPISAVEKERRRSSASITNVET